MNNIFQYQMVMAWVRSLLHVLSDGENRKA